MRDDHSLAGRYHLVGSKRRHDAWCSVAAIRRNALRLLAPYKLTPKAKASAAAQLARVYPALRAVWFQGQAQLANEFVVF